MQLWNKTKPHADISAYVHSPIDSAERLRPSDPNNLYGDQHSYMEGADIIGCWHTHHYVISDHTPYSDHLVSSMETEFMREIMAFLLYGRSIKEFRIQVVQHPHPDGHIDVHILIFNFHLPRGTKDVAPFDKRSKYGHGKQFQDFATAISVKYGLQNPRAITLKENVVKIKRNKGLREEIKNIDSRLIENARENVILSWTELRDKLEAWGYSPEYDGSTRRLRIAGENGSYVFTSAKYCGEKEFRAWLEHQIIGRKPQPNQDIGFQQTIDRILDQRRLEFNERTGGIGFHVSRRIEQDMQPYLGDFGMDEISISKRRSKPQLQKARFDNVKNQHKQNNEIQKHITERSALFSPLIDILLNM